MKFHKTFSPDFEFHFWLVFLLALSAPGSSDSAQAQLTSWNCRTLFYLKPINKVQRSADIRCPVSDQSLLIKITNLPLALQTQSNTISIVHWLKEYIYRIDSYNTFSLNHHKLGFDRMKGWSETGPLISADLRALRQSLALPFVLSGIVTFWI